MRDQGQAWSRRHRPVALMAAVAAGFAFVAGGCAESDGLAGHSLSWEQSRAQLQPRGPIVPLERPTLDSDEVTLGKALFVDGRLSGDGETSCASCHDVGAGGDDGRPLSLGASGRPTARNAPTVLNSGFNFVQYWDGRARTLEEQIRMTVESPVEMGGDWPTIESRLRADRSLATRFAAIYEDGVTAANTAAAIAAYLRSLVTWRSPFDRYLRGEQGAIGDEAKAGYALFVNLGCVSCHQGRNVGGNLFQRFGVMGDYFADRGGGLPEDLGRYAVTRRDEDLYVFKVPSLRNVADTAPYFHDGSVATLEDAVRVMGRYQLGRGLSDDQVEKLVVFLESLSGELEESSL